MVKPNLGEEEVMEATKMLRSHRFASARAMSLTLLIVLLGVTANRVAVGEMPWVRVADDKQTFVLETCGRPFVPWGFNYDHDEKRG